MTRSLLGLLIACALARPIAAAPIESAAELLSSGNDAAARGEYPRAAALAARALRRGGGDAERAEAYRLLGVARFFLGDRVGSGEAFVEYLVLDADAHLDPALVPPEAILLFEEVRASHAAEIAARRPSAPRARNPWLAPVPIYGQIQNGEATKAWWIGGGGGALLALNVGSYLWLRERCGRRDGTCHRGPADPLDPAHVDLTAEARHARALNIASGVSLIGLVLYAAIDGVVAYRAATPASRAQLSLEIAPIGVLASGRF